MIVTIQLESVLNGNPKTLGAVITPIDIPEKEIQNKLYELFLEYIPSLNGPSFIEWLAEKGWKTVKKKTLVVTLFTV
jgi:hypothetical protein